MVDQQIATQVISMYEYMSMSGYCFSYYSTSLARCASLLDAAAAIAPTISSRNV